MELFGFCILKKKDLEKELDRTCKAGYNDGYDHGSSIRFHRHYDSGFEAGYESACAEFGRSANGEVSDFKLDQQCQAAVQAGYDVGRSDGFAEGYEAGFTDRKSGLVEMFDESEDPEDTLG